MEILREDWTCGTFYRHGLMWYRWCFWLVLSNEALIVKVPLRKKIVIPLRDVQKLSSDSLTFGVKVLSLTHSTPGIPKNIFFISTKWGDWFRAFETLNIPAEDAYGLQHASTRGLKMAKAVNLAAGGVGFVVAMVGLLIALVAGALVLARLLQGGMGA